MSTQQLLESIPDFNPGELVIKDESNAELINPMGRHFRGILALTNYRLIFWSSQSGNRIGQSQFYEMKSDNDLKHVELNLPIGFIQEFDKTDGNQLNIKCKDFRNVKIKIKGLETSSSSDRFDKLLECYMNPKSYGIRLFAYTHFEALKTKNTGYNKRVLSSEFQRQLVEMNNWRISKVNHNFEVCETYPDEVAVPKDVTDEQITTACQFRTKNRFPVLCWIHPDTKATLTRSSQPATGLIFKRNELDERFLKSIKEANAYNNLLTVIDARPMVNARANMARGGGIESQSIYTSISYDFLNIPNIHVMRESQRKLFDLIDRLQNRSMSEHFPDNPIGSGMVQQLDSNPNDHLPSTIAGHNTIWWHKALEETKWLNYIRQILLGSLMVAEKINSQRSVFVHCSDGWDRTAQIVSLPQLMLDPYYRTIRGFQTLVDKEWLLMGHKISQRTGGLSEESGISSTNLLFNMNANNTGTTTQEQSNNVTGGQANTNTPSAVDSNGIMSNNTNNSGNISPSNNNSIAPSNSGLPNTNTMMGGGGGSVSSSPKSERAPIFLQFIDCVWQMTQQFVAAFEFNEQLLIELLDAVYSGLYGDFLFNCDQQRRNQDVYNKTLSFWSHVNSDLDRYRNPFYTLADDSGHRVLFPQYRLPCIKLWTSYYLRHYLPSGKQDPELEYSRILFKRMQRFKAQLNRSVVSDSSANNNSNNSDIDEPNRHSSSNKKSENANVSANISRGQTPPNKPGAGFKESRQI